jgi:3'(2'), 5'-bisphosphate nucleotidase / inositol polyphosphate 1-phosphatase
VKTWYRFIRGDQYAVALGLLDEGKVVLGVLACPNLPLKSSSKSNSGSSGDLVGSLFSAAIGCGAEVEAIGGSKPEKVINYFIRFIYEFSSFLFYPQFL